jgi:DNA-binding NtrC family response regulator
MDKQERILVAEDDGRVRQALFDLLTSWGYTVKTAENGVEGLEAIASFHPVVVLSDLRMPRMGGLELLKAVRGSSPNILFLMLTGHGSIASAVEATKLGAFNFLPSADRAEELSGSAQKPKASRHRPPQTY